jgi:uncharacterized protein (DUF302 family)
MPLTTADSPHSVRVTVDRVVAALEQRGIRVFAHIDHAAGAHAAGIELPDNVVLIFGDPKVGTFLIQDDPTTGYELPLRLLFWDAAGQTMIGYRRPFELAKEYALENRSELLEKMGRLLEDLVTESTSDEP